MFKRIDHVEIVTDQLDRTMQFYTEVLGFTVKARDRIERSGLGVPTTGAVDPRSAHAAGIMADPVAAKFSSEKREQMPRQKRL